MITQRLQRATDRLYKQYFSGKLKKGRTYTCACGAILNGDTRWSRMFGTFYDSVKQCHGQLIFPENYKGEVKLIIDETGYTWQELAQVERVFESSEDVEDGLEKVIDLLCSFDKVEPVEVATVLQSANQVV